MTSEQLQHARAERWRQVSNPILTSEDAEAWIEGIGLCLYLPRPTHFATPAPSFVEAVIGTPTEHPTREAIETATTLHHNLCAQGAILPLSLFSAGSIASDQPDFLISRETLPYVFSLIGGRNWKTSPGLKATPLMTDVWTLLNGQGAFSAQEIQSALGRELTEAAVLRALVELWSGLRVIPAYDGETTRWELTQNRFADEMSASQKVAQSTALSALVSLYLDSVIAASTGEIETFLSPLASRSRVREVVNGLSATRQLQIISIAAQPLFHVTGSLPEFAEPEKPAVEPTAETSPREFAPHRERRPTGAHRDDRREAKKPYDRSARSDRPSRTTDRDRFDRGPRRPFDREKSGPPRERTGYGRPATEGKAPFRPKTDRPYRRREDDKPFNRERKPFDRERGAEGRERGTADRERRSSGSKPFNKREFGQKSGYKPASRPGYKTGYKSSERKPFDRPKFGSQSSSDRPARRSDSNARPFDRERSGERREPRPYNRERGDFAKSRGPRKEGFSEGRKLPFRPRRDDERTQRPTGKFGERKSGAKSFGPKKFGDKKSFDRPNRFSDRSRTRSSEGPGSETREKRPFFRDRSSGGNTRPRDSRSDRKPDSTKRSGGWKPKSSGGNFKSSGKPAFKSGGKPAFKKPGFGKSAKPFGKSTRPQGKGGKPTSSKGKPGGFKPPFRKRKEDGDRNAE